MIPHLKLLLTLSVNESMEKDVDQFLELVDNDPSPSN